MPSSRSLFMFGMQAAVLTVVVQAVFQIGSRARTNRLMFGIAAEAFGAIVTFRVPFPLIILTAGLSARRHDIDTAKVGV
jgi:chromate transporter